MKLIRNLVSPWILFFILSTSGLVLLGVRFSHVHSTPIQIKFAIGVGIFLCFFSNVGSLGKVGIWMSESLPESLRYGSWRWILRTIRSLIVAFVFWAIGLFPLMPLVWQAAVIPVIFSITLFVAVFNLIGPILKVSANMAWNGAFAILLSLPVFLIMPLTSLYLSRTIVSSYYMSRPDLAGNYQLVKTQSAVLSWANRENDTLIAIDPTPKKKVGDLALNAAAGRTPGTLAGGRQLQSSSTTPGNSAGPSSQTANSSGGAAPPANVPPAKLDKKSQVFADLATKPLGSCPDHDHDILASLDPKQSEEPVYWAVQAVHCSTIKTTIALTRLAVLMVEHPSPKVRAAAVYAMKKFDREDIKRISYLLFKRINPRESPEVLRATTSVLAWLGDDERKSATKRLTSLLDADGPLSESAARILIEVLGRNDLVANYVSEHLSGPPPSRLKAVNMVCLLPEDKRSIVEGHIRNLIETVHSAEGDDPGIHALGCLGHAGFLAIQSELKSPQFLDRSLAARALSELDLKQSPEALETAETCSRDTNPQVRRWCSRSLGEIGALALPQIIDLLKSNDSDLKASGENALESFNDLSAKDELIKIRSDNSGWLASHKKLQIAQAVEVAIAKIQAANDSATLPNDTLPTASSASSASSPPSDHGNNSSSTKAPSSVLPAKAGASSSARHSSP